jgi:hypothetical protein
MMSRLGDSPAYGPSKAGVPFRLAEASEPAAGLASNRVPVAAQLLTLTDHPDLDLVVVFIREGDRAGGSHSESGLVMEMPGFHHTLRNTQGKRSADNGVPQSEGNPHVRLNVLRRVRPFVSIGSFVEEPHMAKKRKRKYSPGAGTEVKREMHRYKRGKAKSGKGEKGGKVKSRKQAIAIALSKARKKGKKVPRKKK